MCISFDNRVKSVVLIIGTLSIRYKAISFFLAQLTHRCFGVVLSLVSVNNQYFSRVLSMGISYLGL
jgi:hypothetical protein